MSTYVRSSIAPLDWLETSSWYSIYCKLWLKKNSVWAYRNMYTYKVMYGNNRDEKQSVNSWNPRTPFYLCDDLVYFYLFAVVKYLTVFIYNLQHLINLPAANHLAYSLYILQHPLARMTSFRLWVCASPEALSRVLEQDTLSSVYNWFNSGRPVPTWLKICWLGRKESKQMDLRVGGVHP